MPRVVILTMHDVSLSAAKSGGAKDAPPPGGELTLEGTVQTYRYLGDDESKGGNGKTNKGGK